MGWHLLLFRLHFMLFLASNDRILPLEIFWIEGSFQMFFKVYSCQNVVFRYPLCNFSDSNRDFWVINSYLGLTMISCTTLNSDLRIRRKILYGGTKWLNICRWLTAVVAVLNKNLWTSLVYLYAKSIYLRVSKSQTTNCWNSRT